MTYPVETLVHPNPSPRDVCRSGHWPEFLADLGCVGPMWALTEARGVELAQRTDFAGIQVHADMGLLSRPWHALRLLLDRCHSIRAIADAPRQVSIEDENRYPLLILRPDSPDQDFLFRALLRVHTDIGRGLRPPRCRGSFVSTTRAVASWPSSVCSRRRRGRSHRSGEP